MKRIKVEITGVAPLLHNKFSTENDGVNQSKSKRKVYVPEEEAKKLLYQNPDGTIYQPAEHVFQSMVRAATDFKFEGKKTYKDVITSGIVVLPENIALITDLPYEIDARRVVVRGANRAGVIRWRPRFNKWKLQFTIDILDDTNISVEVVKDILDRAGSTKGIGDYRPRFGRFMVTHYEQV